MTDQEKLEAAVKGLKDIAYCLSSCEDTCGNYEPNCAASYAEDILKDIGEYYEYIRNRQLPDQER